MLHLSRGDTLLSDRLVTMAPDVTTTTSLAGFVNKRGTFTTGEGALDNFRSSKNAQVRTLHTAVAIAIVVRYI